MVQWFTIPGGCNWKSYKNELKIIQHSCINGIATVEAVVDCFLKLQEIKRCGDFQKRSLTFIFSGACDLVSKHNDLSSSQVLNDSIGMMINCCLLLDHRDGMADKFAKISSNNPVFIISRLMCLSLNALAFLNLFDNYSYNMTFLKFPVSHSGKYIPEDGILFQVEKCACMLQYFIEAKFSFSELEKNCIVLVHRSISKKFVHDVLNPEPIMKSSKGKKKGKKNRSVYSSDEMGVFLDDFHYKSLYPTSWDISSDHYEAIMEQKRKARNRLKFNFIPQSVHSHGDTEVCHGTKPSITILSTKSSLLSQEFICSRTVGDFANKHIGGGVFGRGSVQEEIMFLTCPDLCVSKYLCEVLDDESAVWIFGAPLISKYEGYSRNFRYAGRVKLPIESYGKKSSDKTDSIHPLCLCSVSVQDIPKVKMGQKISKTPISRQINILPFCITVMDALHFEDSGSDLLQLCPGNFLREVTKAVAAFSPPSLQHIQIRASEMGSGSLRTARPYSYSELMNSILVLSHDVCSNNNPLIIRTQNVKDLYVGDLVKCNFYDSDLINECIDSDAGGIMKLFYRPIVSGRWGCGAFNGDGPVKGLVQMFALSIANYLNREKMEQQLKQSEYSPSEFLIHLELCPYKNKSDSKSWKSIVKRIYCRDMCSCFQILSNLDNFRQDVKQNATLAEYIKFWDQFNEEEEESQPDDPILEAAIVPTKEIQSSELTQSSFAESILLSNSGGVSCDVLSSVIPCDSSSIVPRSDPIHASLIPEYIDIFSETVSQNDVIPLNAPIEVKDMEERKEEEEEEGKEEEREEKEEEEEEEKEEEREEKEEEEEEEKEEEEEEEEGEEDEKNEESSSESIQTHISSLSITMERQIDCKVPNQRKIFRFFRRVSSSLILYKNPLREYYKKLEFHSLFDKTPQYSNPLQKIRQKAK
ncbi:Poly(ADP-ribose) glycohydrolase like protein [Aduncisulcus paluster]|uniref:Poly(ADP-ribose) glycohydrolase like protein n=1 Tax=Aduncisulcus paluster TaxID=2918883 RepID=A0ABQ5KV35_9EUKA|nr:Poly(ADP-ribose) glycohydrolase like protein [Aduncisulcus paluster]